MNIPGYVNPREIGNSEPNEFFKMDIFIEQSVWDKYIAISGVKNVNTTKHDKKDAEATRTWDVCWMLANYCSGKAIEEGTATFPVEFLIQEGLGESDKTIANNTAYDKTETVILKAYLHPKFMALCVGMAADSSTESRKNAV
jgi:hypothetical protein